MNSSGKSYCSRRGSRDEAQYMRLWLVPGPVLT